MKRLLTSLIFSLGAIGVAHSQCLKPNPETVTLRGIVLAKNFPGPPNYRSIRLGDERMRYWILRLKEPVCLEAETDDYFGEPNVKTRDIQLVFMDDSFYSRYRAFVRRRARFTVVGSLFHQETGHHVAKILIKVKTLSPMGN